jgi:hypothetical protein
MRYIQVEFGVRLSLLGALAFFVLGNDGAWRRCCCFAAHVCARTSVRGG